MVLVETSSRPSRRSKSLCSSWRSGSRSVLAAALRAFRERGVGCGPRLRPGLPSTRDFSNRRLGQRSTVRCLLLLVVRSQSGIDDRAG